MHSSLSSAHALRFCILAALALGLNGCGTGGTAVLVPVLDGSERVRVDFTSKGPAQVKADGFEVQSAGFLPHRAPQHPDLGFLLQVSGGAAPRRVTVEDITEESARLIVTDESPAIANNQWHSVITGIDAHDPRIEWLYRMNNDIRIYRFTIIAADGHKVVLNQASNFPTNLKAVIREAFGEKP